MKADFMSYGEQVVSQYLKVHHIYYKYGVVPSWLNGLHLDFYVPSLKLGIEFDGYQHFFPISLGSDTGDDNLLKNYVGRCHRDDKKNKLCKSHGINLLRIENYTRKNLDEAAIIRFLKHSLHKATSLYNEQSYQNILYEPHRIKKFKVHTKMINNSLPIKDKKLWHKIRDYINNQPYGFIKFILTNLLVTSFLHTQDVFKLTYSDVFNKDKAIKDTFREENQSIGLVRNTVVFPPFLKKYMTKYIKYLHHHNLTSTWLFPNLNNPELHVSFTAFSAFINRVAKHFNLKHFNIYSLRKTGAYIVYSQYNLKLVTEVLNESSDIATYDYLGYDGQKLINRMLEKTFGKN